MNNQTEYYSDLKRRIKAGEFRDPAGSQEPERVISDCACEGKGWLSVYTPDQVPLPLIPCVCIRRDTRDRHRQMCMSNCRIDAETGQRLSFDTWATALNPGCTAAFNMAKEFAERPARWLVFRGESGLGKTHLATAAVYALAEQGVRAEYWRIQDLVADLFEALEAQRLPEMITDLTRLAVLAIDDFGAAYVKDFAELQLEGVLDSRHIHRQPTLITTNQTLGEFSPRLQSRLRDPSVVDLVELSGEDARQRLGGLPSRTLSLSRQEIADGQRDV